MQQYLLAVKSYMFNKALNFFDSLKNKVTGNLPLPMQFPQNY